MIFAKSIPFYNAHKNVKFYTYQLILKRIYKTNNIKYGIVTIKEYKIINLMLWNIKLDISWKTLGIQPGYP